MDTRPRAPASAFLVLACVMALPRSLHATERACPAPTVAADADFVARFPGLLDRVQSELANRTDLDACAHVALSAVDADAIQVAITLPDGRTATRSAERQEDVLPTLQALLLVPQPSPKPPSVAPRAARPAPSVAPRAARPAPSRRAPLSHVRAASREHDAASAALEPRALGIELSLLAGARMGGDQLAVGLGARSLLEAYGWLLGFTGRADRYQTPLSTDGELALELGALAGKRFHFRRFALDVIAGPAVTMQGVAFSRTEAVQDVQVAQPTPPDPTTGPVPRLLIGAHAGFSPRSVLRSFVGIEASVGPARRDEAPRGSARLPVLALGIVLGGTVGTR